MTTTTLLTICTDMRYSSLFCVLRGKLVNSVRNYSAQRRWRGYAIITADSQINSGRAILVAPFSNLVWSERCVPCNQKVQIPITGSNRFPTGYHTKWCECYPNLSSEEFLVQIGIVFTLNFSSKIVLDSGLFALHLPLDYCDNCLVYTSWDDRPKEKKINPKISKQNLQYQGRSFCFIIHFVVVILLLSVACRLIYCWTKMYQSKGI